MTAPDLLTLLRSSGFTVGTRDGKLTVRPASRLTEDEREAIVANRDDLLALVDPLTVAVLQVDGPDGPKVRRPMAWCRDERKWVPR